MITLFVSHGYYAYRRGENWFFSPISPTLVKCLKQDPRFLIIYGDTGAIEELVEEVDRRQGPAVMFNVMERQLLEDVIPDLQQYVLDMQHKANSDIPF